MSKRNLQNKQNEKIGGVIIAIIIILLIVIIGFTYSRYLSTGTANVNAGIAKWQIKLNGEDMSSAPITKDVELTYVANDYVKDDRIAPGRKATFDIILDPTGSEVAIDYKLKVDVASITGVSDVNSKISVTSVIYQIGEDGEKQRAIISSDNEVVVREALSDVESGKVVKMTAILEWDNDENLNSHDTANGAVAGTIKVPVTVTAEQHI